MDDNTSVETPLEDLKDVRKLPEPGEPMDLDDDVRAKLAKRLCALWDEARQGRDVDTRNDPGNATEPGLVWDWREYNVKTDMTPKSFPVRGPNGEPMSAQFALPVVHTTVNALMAQWMSVVYDNNPLFQADPANESLADAGERAERYLDYLCDHGMAFNATDRKCVERMAMEGVGIKYWRWDVEKDRRYDRKQTAIVERDDADEGPRCYVVPRQDFHMWPTNSTDPDKAEYVFIRRDMPAIEIEADHDGEKPRYTLTDAQYKTLRGEQTNPDGSPRAETADTPELSRRVVDVVDVYGVYAESGEYTDCLFTLFPSVEALAYATVSRLGSMRPVSFHYAYDHGDDWCGKSVPQIIRGVNAGFRQFVLQAANGATLEHLLNQTAVVDADADVEIQLGKFNPVKNINGFKYIDYRASPANYQMIELFEHQLEKATGLNDNVLGAYAPADTTATQTRAAMGAGSLQFQESIRLRNEGLKRDADVVSRLIAAFAEDSINFYTPLTDGEKEERRKKAADEAKSAMEGISQVLGVAPDALPVPEKPKSATKLQRKVKASDFDEMDWVVAGSVPGLDKQAKVADAMLLIQTVLPMEQDHPERVWEFCNNLLVAMRVENVERFIGEKPEPEDEATPQATPQDIATLLGADEMGGGVAPQGMDPGMPPQPMPQPVPGGMM
jgi:hypothetical protein